MTRYGLPLCEFVLSCRGGFFQPWVLALTDDRYAYDIIFKHGSPFLANKNLFSMAEWGFSEGIKFDTAGNVYNWCGDGAYVWSPGGVLIGEIYLPDAHVGNFCSGRDGETFILNEHKVWRPSRV